MKQSEILDILIKKYKETKDSEIFNQIFDILKPKITTWAFRSKDLQKLLAEDYEGLLSEGSIILLKCLDNFNYSRNKNFSIYFWKAVKVFAFRIIQLSNLQKRKVHETMINFSSLENEDNNDFEENIAQCQSSNLYQRIIDDIMMHSIDPNSIAHKYVILLLKGYSELYIRKHLGLDFKRVRKVKEEIRKDTLLKEVFVQHGLLSWKAL